MTTRDKLKIVVLTVALVYSITLVAALSMGY